MEAQLYLNEHYHTGNLKVASYELDQRCIDVVEECVLKIGQVDPRYHPEFIPIRIRLATNPGELSFRNTEKWDAAERELYKILQSIHLVRSLHNTQLKLSEWLTFVPPFQGPHEAFRFFKDAGRRLGYLSSASAQDRLGTLKSSAYTFVESLVLRRAVYEGVYLTKPD